MKTAPAALLLLLVLVLACICALWTVVTAPQGQHQVADQRLALEDPARVVGVFTVQLDYVNGKLMATAVGVVRDDGTISYYRLRWPTEAQ